MNYNVNRLFRSPNHYANQLAAKRKYNALLKEGHDVVLPPIEIPLPINENFVNAFAENGNLANNWLFNNLVDDVVNKAKGKILIHIVDTGYEAMNKYILPFYKKKYSTEHVGETGADNNGHAHLCAGNLFADHPSIPMGVIRKLAKAGLIDFCFHRVMNRNGSGSYPNIISGIDAAASTNAPEYTRQIISMSFGGSSPHSGLENVLKQAVEKGIFLSASAGNSGIGNGDTMGYPSKYDEVLAWGALKSTGKRDYYSSVGDKLFGMAPGSRILSVTNSVDGLAYWNGTSSSNPIAVGILACISLMYPEIDAQSELEEFTQAYMKDLGEFGFDDYTGNGAPLLSGYFDKEPTDPTDPSDPPNPSTRNKRICSFDFTGDWPMYWRTLSETRLKLLTITSIKIQKETSFYTEKVASEMKTSLDAFFYNRGLIIPEGQDYQDATNYSQFFFDMLETRDGRDIEVLEVTGQDEQGNPIMITEKEIIKWKRKARKMSALPVKLFEYNGRN